MRKFFLAISMCVLPSAVMAQGDAALCTLLPVKEHFVGADYVPGVDVHGRTVVSADIKETSRNNFVDIIKVPVTVDLVKNLGLEDSLPAGAELDTAFGMIEIYKDSRVVFNGAEISQSAYAYCDKEPFDINDTAVQKIPEPSVKPAPKIQEEIIWGEGY